MQHRSDDRSRDETGAVAVEYALLVMLIALAVIGIVLANGVNVGELFSNFLGAWQDAGGPGV